jgi:hypothetical protein
MSYSRWKGISNTKSLGSHRVIRDGFGYKVFEPIPKKSNLVRGDASFPEILSKEPVDVFPRNHLGLPFAGPRFEPTDP